MPRDGQQKYISLCLLYSYYGNTVQYGGAPGGAFSASHLMQFS
jgi:hypothetical protein